MPKAALLFCLLSLVTITGSALAQEPPKENNKEIEAAIELLQLRERLYVLREERRPDKVLKTAPKIIKLDPRDPWPHFIMGEAYMSFGKYYSKSKATAALKRFLRLAGPSPHEEVTGRTVVTRDDRLLAHSYLLRMEDDKPVMLLTPTSVIRKRILAVKAGIANNEKVKKIAEETIQQAEAYIARIKGSGHTAANVHIAAKRRSIAKREKTIKKADEYILIQQEELAALEGELAQRPNPPTVRLSNAGRKKDEDGKSKGGRETKR